MLSWNINLEQDKNIIINNCNFYLKNKTKSITIAGTSLIGIKQQHEIILKHNKCLD